MTLRAINPRSCVNSNGPSPSWAESATRHCFTAGRSRACPYAVTALQA